MEYRVLRSVYILRCPFNWKAMTGAQVNSIHSVMTSTIHHNWWQTSQFSISIYDNISKIYSCPQCNFRIDTCITALLCSADLPVYTWWHSKCRINVDSQNLWSWVICCCIYASSIRCVSADVPEAIVWRLFRRKSKYHLWSTNVDAGLYVISRYSGQRFKISL